MDAKFQLGEKVKVVSTKNVSDVYASTIGRIGKIWSRSICKGKIEYAVAFDNLSNPYSHNGRFYYKEQELTDVLTGDVLMENKYILQGLKSIAQIKFIEDSNSNSIFNYLCFDEFIEVGDAVVVKSAKHGFGLAVVEAIITNPDKVNELASFGNTINREIISKFDLGTYTMRKESRVRMARNDAKRKKLMAAMDEKIAESKNLAYYEEAAKNNPEIRAMLDQLKAIE